MRHYPSSRSSMADTCFRTLTGTKIFLSTHWSVCGLESSTNLWVFERVQNEKAHDSPILSLLDSVKRKRSFVCSLTMESNKRKKEFEKRENEIQWAVWNTVSAPPPQRKTDNYDTITLHTFCISAIQSHFYNDTYLLAGHTESNVTWMMTFPVQGYLFNISAFPFFAISKILRWLTFQIVPKKTRENRAKIPSDFLDCYAKVGVFLSTNRYQRK